MQVTLSEFLNRLFSTAGFAFPGLPRFPTRNCGRPTGCSRRSSRSTGRNCRPRPRRFCLPAARWAATMFYRACQFVAFRDVRMRRHRGPRRMAVACPHGDPPAVHYSVDLTFRYLPA